MSQQLSRLTLSRLTLWTALCGLALFLASPARAATITVTTTADTGVGSLRQAVTDAVAGDTINFGAGVTGTIALSSGEIAIGKDLTITGPGADKLRLSGNFSNRIFQITAGTVTISGLTLTNADTPTGQTFGGGALLALAGSSTTLNGCVVSNSSTTGTNGFGGGIDNKGQMNISHCTISGNSASQPGGGIYNLTSGVMSITNSTISGNNSSLDGGGIANAGTLNLNSCTISDNFADTGGGVVNGVSGSAATATVTATNTVIGNNFGFPDADYAGTLTSADYNLIEDASGATITGTTTHDLTSVDPGLGALANNGGTTLTEKPKASSPAIDAGSCGTGPATISTDQRGVARPIDAPGIPNASDGCDIGAVEAPVPVPHPTPQPGKCGPMDVAFIINDTGSMGTAINSVRTELAAVLGDIAIASGGDYRLSLVTFKNDVTVRVNFAQGNQNAITTQFGTLVAAGGGNEPEASDEALNTVINGLPAAGRMQNIDCVPFRTGDNVTKIVILVTDAHPAGFDDEFTPGVDDFHAHQLAVQAADKHIKITAVYVPTFGSSSVTNIMQDYGCTSNGLFLKTDTQGEGTGDAITQSVAQCGGVNLTSPTTAFLQPVNGECLKTLKLIKGTAKDDRDTPDLATCQHVSRVTLFLRRPDGQYWTGVGYSPTRTPLPTKISGLATGGGIIWTFPGPAPSGVNLPSGTYTIEAVSFDLDGNASTVLTRHVTIDTLPPALTIAKPVNGAVVSSLPPITGSAVDQCGLARVRVTIRRNSDGKFWNGSTYVPLVTYNLATLTGSTYTFSNVPAGLDLPAGSYIITAYGEDVTHLNAQVSAQVTVKPQASALAITAPTNGAVQSSLPLIRGTASSGDGISRVNVAIKRFDGRYWNGASFVTAFKTLPTTLSGAGNTVTFTLNSGLPSGLALPDGLYTITAYSVDGASRRLTATTNIRISATSGGGGGGTPGTTVTVSTGDALVSNSNVRLTFTGPLNFSTAMVASHYVVKVNGVTKTISNVFYSTSTNTVILVLPAGTLHAGNSVTVSFSGLSDSHGLPVSGQVGPFAAH